MSCRASNVMWKHTTANKYCFPLDHTCYGNWWIFRWLDYLPRLRSLHLGCYTYWRQWQAYVVPPKGNRREFLVDGKISSRKYCQINLVILPILKSQSRRPQGTIYSIPENGVGWLTPTCQVVPRAYWLDTEIVFSMNVIFPGKAPFHHKLPF